MEFKTITKSRTVNDTYDILVVDDELYDKFKEHGKDIGNKEFDYMEMSFYDKSSTFSRMYPSKTYRVVKRSDYENDTMNLKKDSSLIFS